MRLSTGLFAVGGLLYLTGLYGFTTFLPGYRDSLAGEVAALRKEQRFFTVEEREEEEWRVTNNHAQWEGILYPAFLILLGSGMVVTGVGATIYLRNRRRLQEAERTAPEANGREL
jgi:hypothetical protein